MIMELKQDIDKKNKKVYIDNMLIMETIDTIK